MQICKKCHGHFSFFTGNFLAFLSRATNQFSRPKFGVFCHGHFFKITGTFSKSVTGKPKNVTGKKTLVAEAEAEAKKETEAEAEAEAEAKAKAEAEERR